MFGVILPWSHSSVCWYRVRVRPPWAGMRLIVWVRLAGAGAAAVSLGGHGSTPVNQNSFGEASVNPATPLGTSGTGVSWMVGPPAVAGWDAGASTLHSSSAETNRSTIARRIVFSLCVWLLRAVNIERHKGRDWIRGARQFRSRSTRWEGENEES